MSFGEKNCVIIEDVIKFPLLLCQMNDNKKKSMKMFIIHAQLGLSKKDFHINEKKHFLSLARI